MDPLVTALYGAALGLAIGFLTAYLAQKGKNAAMAEDIAKITETTKTIEARVSNEAWLLQRKWNIDREAAFQLAKEIGSFEESVIRVLSVARAAVKSDSFVLERAERDSDGAYEHYKECTNNLRQAKFVAAVVFGDVVIYTVDAFEQSARSILTLAYDKSSVKEAITKAVAEMLAKRDALLGFIRRRLSEQPPTEMSRQPLLEDIPGPNHV